MIDFAIVLPAVTSPRSEKTKQQLIPAHLVRVRRMADWLVCFQQKGLVLERATGSKRLCNVSHLVAELENIVDGPLDVCASHQINDQIQVIQRFVDVGP